MEELNEEIIEEVEEMITIDVPAIPATSYQKSKKDIRRQIQENKDLLEIHQKNVEDSKDEIARLRLLINE